MHDLYYDLGVPKDASPEDVKRAYRRKAQANHPDKGGKPERFHAIQRAYDILGDEAKRKRYDENGATDDAPSPQTMAIQALASILGQVLDQVDDIEHTDIVRIVREQFTAQIAQFRKQVKGTQKVQDKLERTLKRFQRKGEGENLLARFIEGKIKQCQYDIENVEAQIKVGEAALDMLKEYEYEVDKPPEQVQWGAKSQSMSMDDLQRWVQDAARGQQKGPGGPKFYKNRTRDF